MEHTPRDASHFSVAPGPVIRLVPRAMNVPAGHGHRYGAEILDGLALVGHNSSFTPERVAQARQELERALATQPTDNSFALAPGGQATSSCCKRRVRGAGLTWRACPLVENILC